MKPVVHFANTDFEFELASPSSFSSEETLSKHPLCLQLQFLPILYASPKDSIAVTHLPEPDFLESLVATGLFPEGLPSFKLTSDSEAFRGFSCLSWGSSLRVSEWARSVGADYPFFIDPKIAAQANGKAYSFSRFRLPDTRLVFDTEELMRWQNACKGRKILKTNFGVSGRGNFIFDEETDLEKILSFCRKEWKAGRPLIGEPFVDRIVDFSTQWEIGLDGQIAYFGATRFETDSRGSYRATFVGPEPCSFGSFLPFLEEHKKFVRTTLSDLSEKGYRGPLGIDALVFRESKGHLKLYPIVEINARRTMSSACLHFGKKRFRFSEIAFRFDSDSHSLPSLLPLRLLKRNGEAIRFSRRLTISEKKSNLRAIL